MIATYASLLATSFLAATLLPGSSEALLVYLLLRHPDESAALVAVASLGNTAGSILNYAMGRWMGWIVAARAPFLASKGQLDRAARWFERYGKWSLLLAWLPVVGDPLTVLAGILRVGFVAFTILVGLGKTLRYVAIAGGLDALAPLWP